MTAARLRSFQTACHGVKELSINGCHSLQLSDLVSMSSGHRLERLVSESSRMPGYEEWKSFSLLHWSSFYHALKCIKVMLFSVNISDEIVSVRISSLKPSAHV